MSLFLPSVLFFLSGLAALVYELAWVARLELSLGGTSASIGVVLAAYMAGLGAGAWLLGGWADRPGRPARRYALLEAGIGVWGLVAPWILVFVEMLMAKSHGAGGIVTKALLALLALLPSTLLMGGTLPVLIRGLTRRSADAQRVVATLYGFNTLGAVAGVVLAEFFLLPAVGLAASSRLMGLLNLLLALVALRFASRLGDEIRVAEPRSSHRAEILEQTAPKVRAALTLALPLAALGGFLGLSLEVAWSRSLGMALGSTRHAFAAVLAATLLGIALGSLASRRVWHPTVLAAVSLFLLAASSALFLLGLPLLLRLVYLLTQTQALSYRGLIGFQWLLSAVAVLPAAVGMGALLPTAIRLGSASVESAGRQSGRIYLANNVAAVLGSLLTSLWLLPWIGSENIFRLVGCLSVGAILWLMLQEPRWPLRPLFMAAALAAVVALLAMPGWRAELLDMNPTRLRRGDPPRQPGEFANSFEGGGTALLFAEEGRNAYVSVRANGRIRQLKIGGKTDASTPNDMPTQLLLGALAFLARPDAQRVCVVGLGAGVTARVAADFPTVERVDVIEIESRVVDASEFFRDVNDGVLERPSVSLVLDDARAHFLSASLPAPYDIIISEPSNPSIAGIANLFTREHYARARQQLADDGVYLQWIQLYETDDWMLRSMVRSFVESFEHADIWWAYPADFLLLGSPSELRYSLAKSREAVAANAGLSRDLWPYLYARRPDDLFSRYLGTGAELRDLFRAGSILTDDRPRLADAAARNRYEGQPPFVLLRELWTRYLRRQNKWPRLVDTIQPDLLETQRLLLAGARYLHPISAEMGESFLSGVEDPEAWALRARYAGSPGERQAILTQALDAYPTHPLVFLELARLHIDAGDREIAASILDELRLPDDWESADLSVLKLRLLSPTAPANAAAVSELCERGVARLLPREESASEREYLLTRLSEAAVLHGPALEALRALFDRRPYDGDVGLAYARALLQRGESRLCLESIDRVAASALLNNHAGLRTLRVQAMAAHNDPALNRELDAALHDFPDLRRHPDLQGLLRARMLRADSPSDL
jgi:predicted membrane-bound spermidine synthase/thioredoxin-like negative regulator of GroEL